MFGKILVPIDLADLAIAQPALRRAQALAALGTEGRVPRVRVMTVRALVPPTYMEFIPSDFDVADKDASETALAEVAQTLDLPEDTVSTVVRLGSVYDEVITEAEDWGADLIVVGSNRPRMRTYLIGSNAATIARHATCSVLIVRGE